MDTETFHNREQTNSSDSDEMDTPANKQYIREIAMSAVMLAAIIVFKYIIIIPTPVLKFGLSFIPILVAAIVLKPYSTVVVMLLADLLGASLFPTGGAFFIGYTFVALFDGAVLGLILGWNNLKNREFTYNKDFIIRLLVASFIVVWIGNFALNTFCISLTIGKAFLALLPGRFVAEIVYFILHIVFGLAFGKLYEAIQKRRA